MRQITFTVPNELHRKIDKGKRKKGMNRSEYLQEIIRAGLESNEKKQVYENF